MILSGHGVILSRAYEETLELAEKAQIPVVTTLLGISSFPTDHFLNVGMPGMHGMAYASMAIDQADLLISLGMRFDDRVTGKLGSFAPLAKVIHVDVDPSEISKNVKATVPIVGDLKRVLRALVPQVQPALHTDWVQHIEQMRVEHPSHKIRETDHLTQQFVIKSISDITDGRAIIVTGVGQHQMWAAQHCSFKESNSLITSGGLGAMGFEVPAALGVKVARPDKACLVHSRGRRLPDDTVRPCHRRGEQHSREVRHHEQQLPGYGATVAGLLLQQGIHGHRVQPQPGLC